MLNTPVAIIIFNRPDLTNRVFEAIRQAQPQKLLVVADGPRYTEEAEKCQKARDIINKVDWECEVLTNFSETNMGCKYRVSSGIDWVFSEVEEAIILEDDCLPAPSFFSFCQNILEYYRNDKRIMMVNGINLDLENKQIDCSYWFSKYPHIWGWASWRRAWQYYDVEMKTWPKYKSMNLISSVCEDIYERKNLVEIFDKVFSGEIDTWDYQWVYTCWCQNGLSIFPKSNLISNLGCRPDATRTFDSDHANLPTNDIWEIKHPEFIVRNRELDNHLFEHHSGGKKMREMDSFYGKVRWKMAVLKHQIKFFLSLT